MVLIQLMYSWYAIPPLSAKRPKFNVDMVLPFIITINDAILLNMLLDDHSSL